MKAFQAIVLQSLLVATSIAFSSRSSQARFALPETWDTPPHPDSTHHLIFHRVSSLLQVWPNTIYRNGHIIVPATIPTGTIVYHGGPEASVPTSPEWLAFDFEHAYLFSYNTGYVISFQTTRDLLLAYFDGSSAAKMPHGPMDSQDVVIWGRPNPHYWRQERLRIAKLCAWGRPLGLDGFVRMEFHFELLLCDFSDGVEVVATLNVLPKGPSTGIPWRGPPIEPPDPPPGWKGSLPLEQTVEFEALASGSWHNRAPGETRVRVDYSGLVTFYDPSLTSLVGARRGVPRPLHRLANISASDSARVRGELEDVFQRQTKGNGVDWGSVTHVVIERYSERLELLQYLLGPATSQKTPEQASLVRAEILTMLSPYITTDAVPMSSTNTSWATSVIHRCSTTQTSGISSSTLTQQEVRIRDAVEGTLREICRRLTFMWVDAFDIEAGSESRQREALAEWRIQVRELMDWLDWPNWTRCNPACSPDAICYLPSWPFIAGDDPDDMTPRCVSLLYRNSRQTPDHRHLP
ncbi:hypothetical protein BV25DRAFT_1791173 [Artomyces pyxidatus]|uniref:Uncharacterized protein n=1 Tax=Artomyces pyxidatus TaxID=48021 RepID=A0ACB8TLF7_9AGAM|nr:hypothetical protein BV25DRAFT_1791173 [Artomyces pyxidatus]